MEGKPGFKGQRAKTRLKYREAILACDDLHYISASVSDIARIFKLSPSALSNQLRNHFPEILQRREKARRVLGLTDLCQRGVNSKMTEIYAEAIDHLRHSDDSIRQTAELYKVSFSGLMQHLQFYHKDIVEVREKRRNQALRRKERGEITGNGRRYNPSPAMVEKYSKAIDLLKSSSFDIPAICEKCNISFPGFKNHLKKWHPDLFDSFCACESNVKKNNPNRQKRFNQRVAEKYREAVVSLKTSDRSISEIARGFDFNPDTFRQYVRKHHPELADASGMSSINEKGRVRKVLVRSVLKYEEAIRIFESSAEPLTSIARRLNVNANSLWSFIKRNRPDAFDKHKDTKQDPGL